MAAMADQQSLWTSAQMSTCTMQGWVCTFSITSASSAPLSVSCSMSAAVRASSAP